MPPGVTAPLALVLIVFTELTWNIAKFVWLLINLSALVSTPILAVRIARRYGLPVEPIGTWTIGLLLSAMSFTRLAIGHGQITLVILWLALVALLLGDSKSPWQRLAGGILLGLALSKPSVLLGAVLFLLLRRRYDVILAAFGVQLIGLFIAAEITNESPIGVVSGYWRVVKFSASLEGPMNLAQSPILQGRSQLGTVLVIAVALLTILAIRQPLMRRYRAPAEQAGPFDFTFYALMSTFMLLVTYHYTYDAVHMLPVFVLVYIFYSSLGSSALSYRTHLGFGATAFWVLVPLLPGAVLESYLFRGWSDLVVALHTLVLMTLMVFLTLRLRSCPVRSSSYYPGGDKSTAIP